MGHMTKVVLTITLVMVTNYAFALDCENPDTTAEMNKCGEIRLKKANDELNRVYKRTLIKVAELAKKSKIADKSSLKLRLIEAQRHWVKFRQADCEATYILWSEGSISSQIYLSCMIGKAEKRIEELEAYAKYDEVQDVKVIDDAHSE